jgi:hypothetical protein
MGLNSSWPLTVKSISEKCFHHVGDWVKVKKRSLRPSTYLMTVPFVLIKAGQALPSLAQLFQSLHVVRPCGLL